MITENPINKEDKPGLSFIPADATSLEDVIKEADFPDDYDAFDDELLDMIP